MGLISQIKSDISRSGQSKEKILYVRSDEKVRVRFLNEIDDGYSFTFHQIWDDGINCLCPKELDDDNDCQYCDDSDNEKLRTYKMYAWSVYNFDTKRVEIALFKANRCSPVQQLVEFAESYGTMLDRDYVLAKKGKGIDLSYTVIPQDKQKFRNEKALPFTREAMVKILKVAFPYGEDQSDSDDEDEEEKKEKKESKKSKKYTRTDEEIPFDNSTKKNNKEKKQVEIIEPDDELDVDWMEEYLDDEDIDVDEFLEYHEVKSLKKLKNKTKKQFKKMADEYLESLDSDDEDEDDEEDDDDEE